MGSFSSVVFGAAEENWTKILSDDNDQVKTYKNDVIDRCSNAAGSNAKGMIALNTGKCKKYNLDGSVVYDSSNRPVYLSGIINNYDMDINKVKAKGGRIPGSSS